MRRSLAIGALAACGAFSLAPIHAFAQCGSSPHQADAVMLGARSDREGRSIVETAVAAGSFETLVAAVKAAGLVEALEGDGPFTVFAPTDEAFAKIDRHKLNDLLKKENRAALTAILTYHVVPGRVLAADVVGLSNATTLGGQRVDIKARDGRVMIDGATVTATDIECRNGVIHVIDTVLMPEMRSIPEVASNAGGFSTLVAAVGAAGLGDALSGDGPFTVLAPTDDAFAKLPAELLQALLRPENKTSLQAILTYHVIAGRAFSGDAIAAGGAATLQGAKVRFTIDGGRLRANDATVVANDIDAANGVIHAIDTVLLPPGLDANSLLSFSPRQLIEIAVDRGSTFFNDGNPAACAAVYEVTVRSLVGLGGDELPASVRRNLENALSRFAREQDPREQAWILRRALDAAWQQLEG